MKLFHAKLGFVCFFLCFYSDVFIAQTYRQLSNAYFNAIEWVSPIVTKQSESQAMALSGGNEVFPILKPTDNFIAGSIYPELSKLGTLDYSDLSKGLDSFLDLIANEIKSQKVTENSCFPDYHFLPVLINYQLTKLPSVTVIRYSRPLCDEEGRYKSLFKISFGVESSQKYCLATIIIVQQNESWYIKELIFDGELYATYARQD